MNRIMLVLVFFTAFSFGVLLPAVALQNPAITIENDEGIAINQHAFRNSAGEIMATGLLIDSDGVRITVLVVGETPREFRLNDLSQADREWVREQIEDRKNELEAGQAVEELRQFTTTGKSPIVHKGIRKVRGFGKHARIAGSLLLELISNERFDGRVHSEALMTYVATTKLDAETASQVLRTINGYWSKCGSLIERDPREFLSVYSRFGEHAFPYLKTVAFTGQIRPNPDSIDVPESPRYLDFFDETGNRYRAEACRAIGKLKHGYSLDVIMIALAAAERPVQGRADEETIQACLEAIGDNEQKNEKVEAVMAKYETKFSTIVTRAREKLEKAREKTK